MKKIWKVLLGAAAVAAVTPYSVKKDEETGGLAELKPIALNAKTDEIKWGNDYIDVAEDVNGIDIKSRVSADVSYLDVTTEGEYPVILYVEDFVGNRTEIPVTLKVEKAE